VGAALGAAVGAGLSMIMRLTFSIERRRAALLQAARCGLVIVHARGCVPPAWPMLAVQQPLRCGVAKRCDVERMRATNQVADA